MSALPNAKNPDVRMSGIGGSDIAPLAGFVTFERTPMAVYEEKLGLRPLKDAGEPAFWGDIFEDPVARVTAQRLNLKIARVNQTLRHRDHPELMAHLDRRVVGSRWAMEIKTTNPYTAREAWGETSDDLPIHVLLQVQHYCEVADLDGIFVGVLIGGQRLLTYEVPRDREMGANIVRIATRFWHDNVLQRVPPSIATYDEAKRLFPQHAEAIAEATPELAETVAAYAQLKASEKRLSDEIETAQTEIASFLGERDTLAIFGDPVLTWRTQKQRRFNEAALKADHPDLHASYVRESTIRVMRLKGNAK